MSIAERKSRYLKEIESNCTNLSSNAVNVVKGVIADLTNVSSGLTNIQIGANVHGPFRYNMLVSGDGSGTSLLQMKISVPSVNIQTNSAILIPVLNGVTLNNVLVHDLFNSLYSQPSFNFTNAFLVGVGVGSHSIEIMSIEGTYVGDPILKQSSPTVDKFQDFDETPCPMCGKLCIIREKMGITYIYCPNDGKIILNSPIIISTPYHKDKIRSKLSCLKDLHDMMAGRNLHNAFQSLSDYYSNDGDKLTEVATLWDHYDPMFHLKPIDEEYTDGPKEDNDNKSESYSSDEESWYVKGSSLHKEVAERHHKILSSYDQWSKTNQITDKNKLTIYNKCISSDVFKMNEFSHVLQNYMVLSTYFSD